jgi:hypothetical protein
LQHIHLLPPDDGSQTGSRHVEARLFNKVRTNKASCWFIEQMITSIKSVRVVVTCIKSVRVVVTCIQSVRVVVTCIKSVRVVVRCIKT